MKSTKLLINSVDLIQNIFLYQQQDKNICKKNYSPFVSQFFILSENNSKS